ncbi:MAG: hypothetical protein AAGB93_13325 [Planctomycetota bacterium]
MRLSSASLLNALYETCPGWEEEPAPDVGYSVGPPLCLIAASIASQLVSALHDASADDYVARFERAMAAFDRGEFLDAAHLFGQAGALATSAPVWRVHRAVALARAGDESTARAEATEALRRGYPPSDLRAIDAALVPAESVEPDLAPERTTTVLRLGVDAAPGRGDCTIGNDIAALHGRAWSLVTGDLVATQRRRAPRSSPTGSTPTADGSRCTSGERRGAGTTSTARSSRTRSRRRRSCRSPQS